MTCSNIKDMATSVAAKVLCNLNNAGVLTWGNREVYLCTEVKPFYDDTIGYIGQMVVNKTPIVPPPKVVIRAQYRSMADIVTKVGDASFDMIPQNMYSKKELESADYWEIDGEQYNLVPGTLKDDPSRPFWSGVLAKVLECEPIQTV